MTAVLCLMQPVFLAALLAASGSVCADGDSMLLIQIYSWVKHSRMIIEGSVCALSLYKKLHTSGKN
jgi:hypothetical protein